MLYSDLFLNNFFLLLIKYFVNIGAKNEGTNFAHQNFFGAFFILPFTALTNESFSLFQTSGSAVDSAGLFGKNVNSLFSDFSPNPFS